MNGSIDVAAAETQNLWGDAVNVAARLSSFGSEASVYLNERARAAVAGDHACTPLGPIEFNGGRRIDLHPCRATPGAFDD